MYPDIDGGYMWGYKVGTKQGGMASRPGRIANPSYVRVSRRGICGDIKLGPSRAG
jgi:hypothetical protein